MPVKTYTIFEAMSRRRSQRTGHLFPRSGSWLLRYWVDSTELHPQTGKPRRERVTITIGAQKGPNSIGIREARRIAWEEYLSKLDEAHTRPSSAKTFMEFVNLRYRPDVLASLKPSTRSAWESLLKCHVLPMLGKVPLREITPAHVQEIINAKRLQKLSPQTIAHIRNRISAVLRHAKAHRWFFGELPTTAVRVPEMVREERKAMTWAEICRLTRALPEPCATLVLFLALTGLRIGEAMGLRWSRVNLSANPLLVDGRQIPPLSLLVKDNYVMGKYQTLKKPSSYRIALIPEWFSPRLAALQIPVTAQKPESVDAVFANASRSAPIDQHNLAARVLKPAAAAIGMGTPAVKKTKTTKAIPAKSWVSWHVLRHSYSTMTDAGGFTMAERMKLLGHSLAEVSLGYTHPELELLRGRMNAMADPKLLN